MSEDPREASRSIARHQASPEPQAFSRVPVQEGLSAEHGGEVLCHPAQERGIMQRFRRDDAVPFRVVCNWHGSADRDLMTNSVRQFGAVPFV